MIKFNKSKIILFITLSIFILTYIYIYNNNNNNININIKSFNTIVSIHNNTNNINDIDTKLIKNKIKSIVNTNNTKLDGTIKVRIRIMPNITKIKFGYLGKGPQRFDSKHMEYILDEITFNTKQGHIKKYDHGKLIETDNMYLKEVILNTIEHVTRNFINDYNTSAELKI